MDIYKVSALIERNLIKKRLVLCRGCEANYGSSTQIEIPDYELRVNAEARAHLLSQANKVGLDENRFRKRLEHPDISLYTVFHGAQLAALYWSLHPTKAVWHDKFLVKPKAALLFGAYVTPPHRRKGLYLLLIEAAHRDVVDKGIKRVFTLIEASNLASLTANQRSGLKIVAHNYLIKLSGRNVFSVYRDLASGKMSVDYVFRTAKGHHF